MRRTVTLILTCFLVCVTVLFFLPGRSVVAASNVSRQGYASAVYFEAVGMDSTDDLSSTIARYSKIQRVSIRFTDLAAGSLTLTPTWDSSATSSIQTIVTGNIRCDGCTVTYSNGAFVIRPAGVMVCTFECIYLNYAAGSVLFNTTPFFTFNANSFNDANLLDYSLPVDYESDIDLTTTNSLLNAISSNTFDTAQYLYTLISYVDGVEGSLTSIDTNVGTIVSALNGVNGIKNLIGTSNYYLSRIDSRISSLASQTSGNEQNVSSQTSDLSSKTSSLSTSDTQLHNLETSLLTDMDTNMNNLNTTSVNNLLQNSQFSTTAQWLGSQMTNLVQGSGTSLFEWTFIFPLVIGIALLLIGRLR